MKSGNVQTILRGCMCLGRVRVQRCNGGVTVLGCKCVKRGGCFHGEMYNRVEW